MIAIHSVTFNLLVLYFEWPDLDKLYAFSIQPIQVLIHQNIPIYGIDPALMIKWSSIIFNIFHKFAKHRQAEGGLNFNFFYVQYSKRHTVINR